MRCCVDWLIFTDVSEARSDCILRARPTKKMVIGVSMELSASFFKGQAVQARRRRNYAP